MRFHKNTFPLNSFPRNASHEMQEKHDQEKERKPRLLILSVGCIARQKLLDISAYLVMNNTGV